jgi:YesN/AraC family two-component response regulator
VTELSSAVSESPGAAILGKRVVICEDEAITIMHLARAFEKAGLRVVGSAANGIEALKVLKHERPDIVTMDIHMPVMNGVEAIRRFMNETPACVVVISAYSDEETRQAAIEAGACAFISKPLNGKDVVREVERAYVQFSRDKIPAST